MIITKNIEIKIRKNNIEHFKKFYPNIKVSDIINIKPEELTHSSHKKILIQCDICGTQKQTTFKNYFIYLKENENKKYTCNRCNSEKRKITCLKIYGVSNAANAKNVKEKSKKTCKEKFGVEYYFQSDEFKINNKEKCLKKYGSEYYVQTEDFKEKYRNHCLEKFGVDNYFKFDEFKLELRNRLIKQGRVVCSDNIKDFSKYKRTCTTLTQKIKNELLNNWSGYDYYDNEYIKDNYNLSHNSRLYPTIDHKISVIYGFLNDITPEIISSLDNLCITKKYINSKKKSLIEKEFKKVMK